MESDAKLVAAPMRRHLLVWLPWVLLLFAAADWLALKTGALSHPPWVLAALVGILALAFLARGSQVLGRVWRGRRRSGSAAGEILLVAGILVALVAGTVNWLLSLQGFLVLHEGQAAPLHGGSHLQEIEAGPLARFGEMHWMLALREVDLLPTGDGFFYPRSVLEVRRGEEQPAVLVIDSRHTGAAGTLRLHQGAFGFAPRIVILKREERRPEGEPAQRKVFDRVVPFTTERRGPGGVTFGGHFTIAAEQLEVRGTVDLASLDEGMRGHATLHLEVRHDGAVLGRGSLLPGHFAEIGEGSPGGGPTEQRSGGGHMVSYRVGFADLKKWSEIDLSRRHYGGVVLAGAGLALVGAVAWPLARWRRW